MRFMNLIKSAEHSKMGPPPAELLQAIGRLGARLLRPASWSTRQD